MTIVNLTASITRDASGTPDNGGWHVWAAEYQDGDTGVITTRRSAPIRPVAGVLTIPVEAGIVAIIENPQGKQYRVTTPLVDTPLWDVIEDAVAYPANTPAQLLAAAVGQYVDENADALAIDDVVPANGGTAFQQKRNGANVGSPITIPSAAWSTIIGKPGDWTNGLANAQTDHSLEQVMRDRISVLRFIPKSLHAAILARTSTTDLTTYFNNAINSGEQLYVPRGRYAVSGVKLIGETDIQAARSAMFIPAANSAAMFYTENALFSNAKHSNIVWEGGRIVNPNNATNVTGFDLPDWRHGSLLAKIPIDGGRASNGMIGVRLRRLNWNSHLHNVEVRNSDTGFLLEEAAACIDILGCVSLNNNIGWFLNGVDFDDPVSGQSYGLTSGTPITLVSIRQGVCQFNNVGVKLRNTMTTRLEKMHFENNGVDIDASGDLYGLAEDCEFAGNNTVVTVNGSIGSRTDPTTPPVLTKGIKLRNTTAFEVRNPTYFGTRQLGFWDVDSSNTRSIATHLKVSTVGTLINSALADTSVVAPAWTGSTAYTLGTLVSNGTNLYYCIGAGTSASSGGPTGTGASITDGTAAWTYAAAVPTVNRKMGDVSGLLYGYDPGYYQALNSTNIDLDQPFYGYVRTVLPGGHNISLSNKNKDGRRARLILRGSSGVTDNSPVRVDGKLVAIFNAADALKNTIVDIEVNNALANGPVITVAPSTHGTGATDGAASVDKTDMDKQVGIRPGGYTSGQYYMFNSPGSAGTSATLGFGSLRLSKAVITAPVTLSRMFVDVTAAGDAASVFRFAIYNDDGTGKPGTLALDGGTVSTGAVAVVEATVSVTLQPGVYWVGGALQGTGTQPTLRVTAPACENEQIALGSTLPASSAVQNIAYGALGGGVTGALPTTFTVSASGTPPARVGFKVA